MKGVFSHKPDSRYDDVKGEHYHFPKMYLSRVEKTIGDWIAYYEQIPARKGRFYTGIGRVLRVRPDEIQEDHYYADLTEFLDFDRDVPYREDGGFEKKLVQTDGTINGGTAQSAVRIIDEQEFARIVQAGLSEEPEWPDRVDEPNESSDQRGMNDVDSLQPEIIGAPVSRPIINQMTTRKWRDEKFKLHVRKAYDRTCAFTGLRLVNGRGRPEVEAAHIRPVKDGGNDWVRNGIALSGTVHWMFDVGMLSLSNDYSILVSRQLNQDISHLLNKDRRARIPREERLRPHPEYMSWHRENVFKG